MVAKTVPGREWRTGSASRVAGSGGADPADKMLSVGWLFIDERSPPDERMDAPFGSSLTGETAPTIVDGRWVSASPTRRRWMVRGPEMGAGICAEGADDVAGVASFETFGGVVEVGVRAVAMVGVSGGAGVSVAGAVAVAGVVAGGALGAPVAIAGAGRDAAATGMPGVSLALRVALGVAVSRRGVACASGDLESGDGAGGAIGVAGAALSAAGSDPAATGSGDCFATALGVGGHRSSGVPSPARCCIGRRNSSAGPVARPPCAVAAVGLIVPLTNPVGASWRR